MPGFMWKLVNRCFASNEAMPVVNTALNEPGDGGQPLIPKSKFLWGVQCPKLLWHAYNAQDQIPKPDASQQAIFGQSREVGTLAKELYPGGIEVAQGITDLGETLQLTKKAI